MPKPDLGHFNHFFWQKCYKIIHFCTIFLQNFLKMSGHFYTVQCKLVSAHIQLALKQPIVQICSFKKKTCNVKNLKGNKSLRNPIIINQGPISHVTGGLYSNSSCQHQVINRSLMKHKCLNIAESFNKIQEEQYSFTVFKTNDIKKIQNWG